MEYRDFFNHPRGTRGYYGKKKNGPWYAAKQDVYGLMRLVVSKRMVNDLKSEVMGLKTFYG